MSSNGTKKGLGQKFHQLRNDWKRAQGEWQVQREREAQKARFAKAAQQYNEKKQTAYKEEDTQKFWAKYGPRNPRMQRIGFRVVSIVAVASLAANVVMYSRWSNDRPLVRVGPRVVTRGEYYNELDQSAGKVVLSRIVLGELVRQAAAANHVPPSESDIDSRIAAIRRTHPQGLPAQDTPGLRDQIGLTLALENLRILHVDASDAEVDAYYDAHQGEFALPTQMHNTVVLTGKAADAALAAKLLHDGQTPQAIASHPGLHVVGVNGFAFNMNSLPPVLAQPITQRLMAMKTGDVQTFPVSKIFITFAVKERDDATLPSLAQIQDQVARQVKLAKAPSEQAELRSLYRANRPSFDMANYAADFRDFDTPAQTATKQRTASLP
jgi:hypothetical protein